MNYCPNTQMTVPNCSFTPHLSTLSKSHSHSPKTLFFTSDTSGNVHSSDSLVRPPHSPVSALHMNL